MTASTALRQRGRKVDSLESRRPYALVFKTYTFSSLLLRQIVTFDWSSFLPPFMGQGLREFRDRVGSPRPLTVKRMVAIFKKYYWVMF